MKDLYNSKGGAHVSAYIDAVNEFAKDKGLK
jgi:hypothetical protein